MENNVIQIAYVGFSMEILDILMKDDRFSIKEVVAPKGRFHEDVRYNLEKMGIKIFEVNGKEDIIDVFRLIHARIVVMYKFGFIIPDDIIKRFLFFNIHWGNLRSNRGAHSLRWSVLLQDKVTQITLYQIDGIDEGMIIGEESVSISEEDNVVSIEKKMNNKLSVLVDALYGYVSKKTDHQYEIIKNGFYRRKIQEADYRIELDTDNYSDVRRKINAVSDFGGAVVLLDGIKRRVFDAKVLCDAAEAERAEKQGSYLYLSPKGEWIELYYKDFILV